MNEGIKKPSPPKAALRLLSWFCPTHLYEEIEGDLIQRFNKDIKSSDHLPTGQAGSKWSDDYRLRRAKRRLIWNVVRFLRPGIVLRNKFSIELNQAYMLQNYFITTLRMLRRNKSYSFINILGLAIGIASALLITLWVEDEYTSNYFFPNHENIYQVKKNSTFNNVINTDEELCMPAYQALKSTD
ncbi:MAG TPA: permease prefix domain 2-containing transporter, partial [Cyclobacteriaceae bacterium]